MKVIGDKMRQYPEGIYKNDETKTALVASMRYALMDVITQTIKSLANVKGNRLNILFTE